MLKEAAARQAESQRAATAAQAARTAEEVAPLPTPPLVRGLALTKPSLALA